MSLRNKSPMGSSQAPPMSFAAARPLVTSASYDKQASDMMTIYKTKAAEDLFKIMADDVKNRCEALLVEKRDVNGNIRCAIKGVVTSRLKGHASLETKLTSADGRNIFLEWFEKAGDKGKTHPRLIDSPDMGDLAAVRIGLYLPGDVIEVARRINHHLSVVHPFGTVMDPTRKAAMIGSQDFTRHDRGRFEEGSGLSDDTWEHYGYKSWQVVVGWDGSLPTQLQTVARLFSPLKVEIQVGTVVTQAWAEVQHNIIYKQPKDIRVTNTMKRMVDATNGMAITTDIILRELERSHGEAKAEAEARRKRDRDEPLWGLWEYCQTDDADGAKKIIGSGFDLSRQDDMNGETALHTASSWGASKVIVALLDSLDKESAARIVRIRDKGNRTVLQTAARCADYVSEELSPTFSFRLAAVVRALLPHCDTDMIMKSNAGQFTALEYACLAGCCAVIRELVSALDKTDLAPVGYQLLLNAAVTDRADVVKELARKFDVNTQAKDKNTALHEACRMGHVSVVEELINQGADVTMQDGIEKTAYDVAEWGGYPTIMALLEAHYRRNKFNTRPLSGKARLVGGNPPNARYG